MDASLEGHRTAGMKQRSAEKARVIEVDPPMDMLTFRGFQPINSFFL